MSKWIALCLLLILAVGGCGSGDSARVSAAVNAVDPKLRSFYSHSYAGFEVEDDRLVVYRKPDATLDAFVQEHVDDIDVEFRDAPYSLDELEPLTERVRDDWHYWADRQFPITFAIPRTDGTGVNAFVAAEDLDAARAKFRQRYGDEPIVVDRPARTGIVPAR
jgi:hypothetical protein